MRYSNIAATILLSCGAASSALAAEHRQHEAHEHGGGKLDVAIERHTLMIDLSLPAMNVVGFEHPANNDEEHEQLARAVDMLKDGMRLFAPSAAAGCKLVHAELESALVEEGDHHDEGHHDDEHDDGEHDHEHADFDVAYEFTCAQSSQLSALTLSLFKLFPGTQHLETQLITPTRQGGAELTADNNVLQLK
jgi:hypothetical protein